VDESLTMEKYEEISDYSYDFLEEKDTYEEILDYSYDSLEEKDTFSI
jgi:hypothetical protein